MSYLLQGMMPQKHDSKSGRSTGMDRSVIIVDDDAALRYLMNTYLDRVE